MSSAVSKVARIAVGAVVGFAQTGSPWGALAGAALAFYVSSQQDKLDTGSLRSSEPSSQTLRSSKAAARYVLGRVSTGGVLAWGQEQAGDQADGEWLHMVYVLSEGEIDAVEDIYLGEEVIQTYGEHASYELVTNPTQVNAFLKANSPDWRDTQIGRGLSFVRLSFRYSAEKYPSGIPEVRFVLRGRRDIYDPRTGTTGYSENTALHILWFLRNRCGVPDDEIVFSSFASSANVCDEMLANADGSTSARYRSGCVIGADESRTQVMQKLEAACGGKLIRVGGRWMLQVGAYYGPYDFEITEDMVISTVTGSTEPTNDSAINTVRGTFVDPSQAWAETDYPEVSVSQWVVADGGEAAETLSFSYVSNPYQAQRLANIELRRRRAGGTLSIPMNFMGYNCRPGRSVKVNLPSLNIVGEFIVTDWSMSPDSGCNVSVAQNEPAIFDDAVGQPYNPIGFISLPAGGLGSPTGLTWSTEDNAEVVQGTLAWVAPYGVVTGYAITVRQGSAAVQAQQVPATTLKLPLSGLPSGNYTMSVAALGPLTRSGEASITVNIDGPPVPEACVVQATIDTITLYPSNTLHGLNGGTYEYFYSTNPQATQGEYLGQGLTLSHTGLAFATNYAYFIRSKNAYGVSAFLKVVASTSTDVKTMLDALKDKIEGGQLAPALRQEISLISGPPTLAGSVAQRLAAEATARGQAIAAEATARGQAIAAETTARNQAIATEVVDRNKAIAVETQARTKAISDESAARAQGLLSEAQARGAAITSEAQARQSADESLSQKIDTLTASAGNNAAAIQAEATTRANADSALGQQIENVAANTASNAAAISNETTARTTADAAMASQIASLRAESGGFDSTLNYGFASTVEGWTGTRCALTVENGRLIVTNDDTGASYLNSPVVSLKGRDHDRIRCRITRRAGSGWNGQVTYVTANHASSSSYRKLIADPGLAVGQTMVLEWDMSQLTNGGSDWSDSTITRFYLWLSSAAGDVFEIDWIAVGQIAPSASVASVVDERTARISGDEANASAVTALTSSLTTTNQNVTAAQQAAQDAATLAGGKGKVLVQATAPAAADRLAQNLWIDTTGNANTPKRWNGTAWVAVTDKVATDAAAAAQSALSQLAGKADASALQTLSTTVANQGNTLSSQGSSITELNNSLQTTNGNVATAQQAAQAAASLAGSKGKVLYQSATPAVADRQAENLWVDTTGNANTPKRWNGSAWVAVTDKVAIDAAAAAASALAQVANKADASALQALNSTVTNQGTTLTSQGAALTQLKASIGQQPDNLILRGSFEDGLVEPWTNGPVITNISAHPSAGKGVSFYDNSFCGIGFNVLTKAGEQFDLAADIWPNYMTAGQTTRLQMQFYDKTNANLGYFTAFTVPAGTTGFKTYTGRITAPEGAVSARFVTRTEPSDGTGRSLWCNILARRVTAADAANADAVSNLTTTVTQQGSTLTSHGQALTQLNNDLQTVAQGKADASALQTLSNTVNSQGSTLSSQGASITQLNSGLQTTNGNVTTAQQAAQAASDKAGAKGEVIYGSAAPATDKRLAQNLWIDTTGGANTPKRWTGSAWVAVTDKAATDAAAAAASALAQVATKAEASALQTLSNTVTSQGNTLASQGNALTGLQASIGNLAGNGANLLDSDYSWLASATLPVTGGALLTKTGVAVPEADSGFGYSLQAATDSIFSYIVMAPANNQANFNIRVEPGVYLVSMYVKGGTAGSMMANLYDGVTSRSVILPYTTERTRITFPITITASAKVGLLIYPNRHAAASASMVVDSIMVEKRVGESNVPSPFVAGPSARATGALAAANQALDVRVTQTEAGLSSNSAAVTSLGNSLQTTNGNVSTAQQAAQAAADLAGSKGKVLYQTATPAAADRQAENLWIDTTGAANTPKRWNGSAWVAVTDKVATDAAAAAQSALTQLASKADASALQTLQSTVTSQGNTIESQGSSLTQLKASLNQQPDNLVLRGSFEDGVTDPWTAGPTIASLTAHASAGKAISFTANSFCGVAANVLTTGGEQFDLSADIYRAYMTAGQTGNFQMQFFDKAGASIGYVTAFTFSAGGGFQTFSGRITAPPTAVSARFLTRIQPADGTGRALWCNILARRITAADTANADAISTLGASVTQQGSTLTSQGQALTQLQSSVGGIGGNGANLLSDEYSWLTSTVLPASVSSSGVTRAGVAVPEADSGFGYQVGGLATAGHFLMLSPTNNVAGYNVRIEPGVYLVSMYVRGSAAGSMRASLFDGTGRISADVAYTTSRTRITLPITVTDSTRAAITLYLNRTAVADLTLVIDSVMIEKRIGESNVPSPFVAGPSARAVGGQATAISQMDTAVKQQGTAITAQASRLDGLYVQVNPEMEGDSSGLAGATGGLVGVWTEQSARIEDGIAMGRQVETVQAQLGQTNASVQQVSEVMADINGRVSAQTTLKVETNQGGRKVVSGIAIGSNGEEGEILLMAQRLAIIDNLNGQTILPFVVEGGQVFINQAVINTAFIQQIVAGMTIRSAALNTQGLPLLEINFAAGTFTLRGQDANGSTLLNNGGLYVYDANGIERTAVGRLT
ncbi:phage tail tip fiber protein [Pseudomonas sp. NY15349]|uniref:phage tail tip fiber protein n=1 Tax=Pseudomonas sp. NY15349 TaxID=3400350 RepID=UPI003A85F15B